MLHCASLEMYINLLYIIPSLFIPPSFYTEDKLALITFKTFFLSEYAVGLNLHKCASCFLGVQ